MSAIAFKAAISGSVFAVPDARLVMMMELPFQNASLQMDRYGIAVRR